jgi:hypothetical protein
MGTNTKGIGSKKATSEPVCVGTIWQGKVINNCLLPAHQVCVTEMQNHDTKEWVLVVLGACDKHVERVSHYMANRIAYPDVGVMVMTHESLMDQLSEEDVADIVTPILEVG